jgi:nucleoid-associated protein YgaU
MTPGPIEPGPIAPSPALTDTLHRIRPGDTLGAIAQATYGDAARFGILLAANPGIRPRALRVGSLLRIPAPVPTSAATPRSKP